MRLTLFTIFTLGFISILLSGLHSYSRKAALEFEQFINELDIPYPLSQRGYFWKQGGLFATDKRGYCCW
ncbi:MAG: hypothetical protein CM15mP117_03670 [Alphaproteobacteria bacterium]|nr:MAG: hypothetical protein CM15mP117_03670 [Alphaproteobacteria bacterium]